MADFNKPTVDSEYTQFPTEIRAAISAALSFLDGEHTNVPLKAKRWNSSAKIFEEYNGTQWMPMATEYKLPVDYNSLKNKPTPSSAINDKSDAKFASSAAVKTAYDKGVDAKTAADNAQRSANDGINRANNAQSLANAANNNANGRVSKSGDTMTGSLAITGSQSGGFANGLMLKNKAGGQNTSVFVDFYQTDNIPRASMLMKDAGNNSTQIEFLNTPEGANWDRDSRQTVFTITSSGNLWSRAYGWLHDKFASKSDVYAKSRFRHQWYGNYYEGAEVFDVPMGDNGVMRTIIMAATIDGYAKLNLPESFNGTCRVQVMDVGRGRHVVGANIQNGNAVEVFNNGHTGLSIIAIGWYGW